jgi:hypothetical protein
MDWVANNIFTKLFMSAKFLSHRLMGLSYLIQYSVATYLYFANYDYFINSFLIWSLPLTGLLQSINASLTFTFLPKKADPGYYTDKASMSYGFICENIFYAGILCFQWLYMSDYFYPIIQKLFIPELICVFFPYVVRLLFPKTSFRDAIYNDKNKSEKNKSFFVIGTYVTKVFYVWAKHYIGYYLNYVRFLNGISLETQRHMYLLLISGCFATTISLFLHTLKFKKYIDAKLSFGIYIGSYLSTFYSYYQIGYVFFQNPLITGLTFVGLVLNFARREIQWAWQIIMCVLLFSIRYGYISI